MFLELDSAHWIHWNTIFSHNITKAASTAGHGDYNCSNVPSKQIPAQRDHIRVRLFQYVPHPKTTQPPAKPRHFKDQILYGFHDLLLEKTAASIFIRVGLASDRDDRDFIPSFRRCFVSVLNMCFKLAAVLHFTWLRCSRLHWVADTRHPIT